MIMVNERIRTLLHSYTVSMFNEKFDADMDFKAYAIKVYRYFESMLPGAKLNLLAYEEKQLKWILLTFVAFYYEGPHWLEYDIADDYCSINRRDIPPDMRQWEIEQWRKWKEKQSAPSP